MKGIWYEAFNFNLKFSYFVKKTSLVEIPLYHYIQREGSIMHTISKKHWIYLPIVMIYVIFYRKKKIMTIMT